MDKLPVILFTALVFVTIAAVYVWIDVLWNFAGQPVEEWRFAVFVVVSFLAIAVLKTTGVRHNDNRD